ncbi:bacterio-opsin activator [Natronorubrum sp. JWXQ-INN-674]|uniref:Bacterio-opsin activator n=1 Tax=Natronorubrum halalkaliphilum TaxID=2691917 RepID=A0A6B0VU72_9EURY|nr:helix-turn-helix domain-containing protein [Natronorubrum halalkaliphilum]MXV64109.1 bacterio-opsin activator [Natronorubrum halalkaliphilum]
MGFITEIHLVHDDLPLVPTIERRSDVTFRYEYGATSGGRRLQFVSALGGDAETLERTIRADPTVSNPTRIAAFENRVIYRVDIDTDLEIVPGRCVEAGLFIFTLRSADWGWVARVYVPDRDVLSAFRARCRDHDVSFRVTQLYDSSVTDDRTDFLTAQQREILTMAYYAGYFDIPRAATQDDLAERLDITDSAVSQRLRRAISELVAATLETDCTPDRYG